MNNIDEMKRIARKTGRKLAIVEDKYYTIVSMEQLFEMVENNINFEIIE